ncbi:hypothetical protein [Methylorubrum salsuginis]|uniref:Uncharacterized protein n=1 Tax=Methylorubrum salsuginis TaxID=414703 RepID=A0A1I4FQM6_9HYPH|nr:hypothetical protein [Methylorubrum salsuginis]SFL19116.1 hypothetical protein SAMN04488125_110124 [Methylorubrum salsuginis]
MSKIGDLSATPVDALTSEELQEIARRIERRRETGLAIPCERIDLYAEALRALARERAKVTEDVT